MKKRKILEIEDSSDFFEKYKKPVWINFRMDSKTEDMLKDLIWAENYSKSGRKKKQVMTESELLEEMFILNFPITNYPRKIRFIGREKLEMVKKKAKHRVKEG